MQNDQINNKNKKIKYFGKYADIKLDKTILTCRNFFVKSSEKRKIIFTFNTMQRGNYEISLKTM